MKTPSIFRFLLKLLLLLLFIPFFLLTLLIIPLGCAIRPFSRRFSIYLGTIICYTCWSITGLFFRLSINMTIPEIPKNNYLVISNHISATDFMVINRLNFHNMKDTKYVIKRSLRILPIFYQGVLLAKFLIVSRSFENDRQIIEKYLKNTSDMKLPMWLVLFCEGHRFTDELAVEAEEFCKSRGIRPFRNVLCPRYKGFELILEGLRDKHIRKILDVTVCPRKTAPSLFDILFTGKVFDYRCDVRVVEISDVGSPREFLEEAFRRKDDLIDGWRHEGFK